MFHREQTPPGFLDSKYEVTKQRLHSDITEVDWAVGESADQDGVELRQIIATATKTGSHWGLPS
jgi:hypothetical protein